MITQTPIQSEVLSDDAVRLSCLLSAAPSKVYDAWTRPEAIAKWFAPQPGATCHVPRFDLRVGGEFEIVMQTAEGENTVTGKFEMLELGSRIGFTWGCHAGETGGDHAPSHVLVELWPEGDGTRLQLTDSRLLDASQAASHTQGWTSCLASLADFVSTSR